VSMRLHGVARVHQSDLGAISPKPTMPYAREHAADLDQSKNNAFPLPFTVGRRESYLVGKDFGPDFARVGVPC
jgi:hypothetical protein